MQAWTGTRSSLADAGLDRHTVQPRRRRHAISNHAAAAFWMKDHSNRRSGRPAPAKPIDPPGWLAHEAILAGSTTGFRPTVRHIWRLGGPGNAIAYVFYRATGVLGVCFLVAAAILSGITALDRTPAIEAATPDMPDAAIPSGTTAFERSPAEEVAAPARTKPAAGVHSDPTTTAR